MDEIQVDEHALSEVAAAAGNYAAALRQAAADLCREANRFNSSACDGSAEFAAVVSDMTRRLDGCLIPAEELAQKAKTRAELLRRRVRL